MKTYLERGRLPVNIGVFFAVGSLALLGSGNHEVSADKDPGSTEPKKQELHALESAAASWGNLAVIATLSGINSSHSKHTPHKVRHHYHRQPLTAQDLPAQLRRIGGCESNGSPTAPIDYHAQNPSSTASGGFQVLDSTWGRFHGYNRAMDAPPSVQNEFADKLYAEEGTTPWVSSEACWD